MIIARNKDIAIALTDHLQMVMLMKAFENCFPVFLHY